MKLDLECKTAYVIGINLLGNHPQSPYYNLMHIIRSNNSNVINVRDLEEFLRCFPIGAKILNLSDNIIRAWTEMAIVEIGNASI